MTPSRKKVIVRHLTGKFFPGYLAPSSFVRLLPPTPGSLDSPRRILDLLDLDGHTHPLPLSEIKFICFVRDFNRNDPQNPERLTRRAFLSRPRASGLWLRLTFIGGDQLEGLTSHDITLLDSLLEDCGVFLTPPDERSNTHRIYVPRTAIVTLEVLAVINAPSRRPVKFPVKSSSPDQPTLFSP